MYYEDHYSDFIKGQNARNEKNRHPERNRTTEDLLKNKMTCPEETIFQIGKEGEHMSGEQLFHIADSFMKRFEGMFGDHVHILDFALHMDETTPHIHERHVFEMCIRDRLYGICWRLFERTSAARQKQSLQAV